MFEGFFYNLRQYGVPVSPTSFLQLNKALEEGLMTSLDDFYVVARALMVKRERHFDIYDRVFANTFEGQEMPEDLAVQLSEELTRTLLEWLQDPDYLASLPDEVREELAHMSPEELVQYFLDRLADQTEAHHGGNRWIGSKGRSPVGHSGYHPGGMRVGGGPGRSSAIKVAMERRYIDYAEDTPLTSQQLSEALRMLRLLAPVGPRDELNIDKTIDRTVRQAGEIELVFDRRMRDKLSVFLFIDNGGWSMLPHVERTRSLFTHARDAFKRLRTFFFHNCIYDTVWEDPRRYLKPIPLETLLREDEDTRVIIVGDASMSPYELHANSGAIDMAFKQRRSGIDCLTRLADRFPSAIWVNPIPRPKWKWTYGAHTIGMIGEVFPMTDLTLPGIEELVALLRA